MMDGEYELGYLRSGVPQLEGYLLSKELYWPIGASPLPGMTPYPQLTLGGILLSLAKLSAQALTPEQNSVLSQLRTGLDATRSHWRVAWEQKAQREFQARLSLWRDYVEEYRQHPSEQADRYTYEVSRRVMLELLSHEARSLPDTELDLLAALDKVVLAKLLPGKFLWEEGLAGAFPPETYWYLYRQPK